MSRGRSGLAVLVLALGAAAGGAAAVLITLGLPGGGEDDEAARWRARALEAERSIARLRAELQRERARGTAPASLPPVASAAPAGEAAAPPAPPAPATLRDPALQADWDALVGGALDAAIEERGRDLAPEQRDRLVARLRAVRDAGLRLESEPSSGEDTLRLRLARTALLLETDRAFREELGVGVGDFLQGLDPGAVEEISPVDEESRPEDAPAP